VKTGNNHIINIKFFTIMKKIILMMAVAMAALSCGNKAEKAEEAAPVEAVQPAPAAPAEEAAPEKEQTLIERAIELGQDVAAEVEKNK